MSLAYLMYTQASPRLSISRRALTPLQSMSVTVRLFQTKLIVEA